MGLLYLLPNDDQLTVKTCRLALLGKRRVYVLFSVSVVVLDRMVYLEVRIIGTFIYPSPIRFIYYDLISNLCTIFEMSASLYIANKYFISPKYYFRTGSDSRALKSNIPAETFV